MSPFRLALLNLWRRQFTTLIALVALALPVAAGGMIHRLHQLAEARFQTMDAQPGLVIGAKSGELDILLNSLNGEGTWPDFFTANLYEGITTRYVASYDPMLQPSALVPPQERDHHLAERREVLRHAFGMLLFGKIGEARVMGTTPSFWQRPDDVPAVALSLGREPQALNEVALGSRLAKQLGLRLGDQVQIASWITDDAALNTQLPDIVATVTGIVNATGTFWDMTAFATLQQAQTAVAMAQPYGVLHPVWQHRILHYIIAYDEGEGFPMVSHLVNNATIAQAISVPQQQQRLFELTGTRQQLGFLVSLLALGLGTLAVIGIMVTRFDFMRAQLNVLRAIGYRRREISGWLVWEGLLLGTAAIAVGATLDFLLFPAMRALSGLAFEQAVTAHIPLWYSSPVWLGAMCAAIIATVIPLWQLYRQSVHHGLRQS